MPKIVIIADDLTGANDTGLQFAKAGLETFVALVDVAPEADVLVINTQSRTLPAKQAGRRAAHVARRYREHLIYKKMDSTGRGHLGVELAAMMQATGRPLAVLTPAFPAAGRTVRAGRILVDGIPVEQTALAHDPTFPVRDSYLPSLLAAGGVEPIALIGLETIERGPTALAECLSSIAAGVVVCDAETDAHLRIIAQAIARLERVPLLCGSAGLASVLPDAFGWRSSGVFRIRAPAVPILVIAGSRHPVTIQQCRHAQAAGITAWWMASSEVARGAPAQPICHEIAEHLRRGNHALLAIDTEGSYLEGYSERIAKRLAKIAWQVIEISRPGALVLTGGDIAQACCRQAGAIAIRLEEEILPGIPAGRLVGGALDGLPLATKAGGFGPPDAFIRIVAYFQNP